MAVMASDIRRQVREANVDTASYIVSAVLHIQGGTRPLSLPVCGEAGLIGVQQQLSRCWGTRLYTAHLYFSYLI